MELNIKDLVLDNNDKVIIKNIVDSVYATENINDAQELLNSFSLYLKDIPEKILSQAHELKYRETINVLAISDLPFYSQKETTPNDLEQTREYPISKDEIQMMLLASLVGDVFTWDSIQEGRMVNHVFPIKENASKLISSNYEVDFGLHTEDAFHEHAGDYLVLYGYKNPQDIPTTVVFIDSLDIPLKLKKALFKKDYIIRHNMAHDLGLKKEKRTSILFGTIEKPYIRINFNEGRTKGLTKIAENSLAEFKILMLNNRNNLIVKENQLCIIDNYKTIHGRDKYTPKFDGNDRWLKRLYVTRDLRKSRELRKNADGRILMVK